MPAESTTIGRCLHFSDSIPSHSANQIKKGLWVDYYNSAISEQLNENFEIYNKSKLVVGVENLPYKNILRPLIGNYLIDLGGTVASRVTQDNRTNFINKKIKTKVAPIICYEAVYGEFVTDYVKSGSNFLSTGFDRVERNRSRAGGRACYSTVI